jgi:hypothetical protein
MHPKAISIPPVLAGPILRRVTTNRVAFWFALSVVANARVTFSVDNAVVFSTELNPESDGYTVLKVGEKLSYLLLDLSLKQPLPEDCWISYQVDLNFQDSPDSCWSSTTQLDPDLCYPGRSTPGFMIPSRIASVLHGSCRKPHHDSGDGLVQAERMLGSILANIDAGDATETAWPSMLVMSGDQIYGDDVAGPMLHAIHQLLERLELPAEALNSLELEDVSDSSSLYVHADSYYRRENLLPKLEHNKALLDTFFSGVEKPIFTTDTSANHLITLGEYLAMYLLVWSPIPWQLINIDMPELLNASEKMLWGKESSVLTDFVEGLPDVRRLLAHIPVAMIFDDHDITDDWNLNRHWEEAVYGHPFSQRVVGNGLLAYLINQGWGNSPEDFDKPLLKKVSHALTKPGEGDYDVLIEELLSFENWSYEWPTSPPMIVLDTRTRRWRSESSAHKPSGLLDWEALTDLQRSLRGHSSVLLVSTSPIYGVKLIEVIQRIFTWFGKSLMVDAEYWMNHPGTANGILNVFRHPKTPQNFVVLSGDVHYSFVYDVELRGSNQGPDIWQICSSGLRNNFPKRLLSRLDYLNRWLYSARSPLNWFTKRRNMRIIPRKPDGESSGRRLLNAAGIGLVELDEQGRPWRIRQLVADGKAVSFTRVEDESRWD